ncbi:oocyte zinc finger protein XlCOF28 [Stomoxys calcitrans]|uniref:oocyte zinc finger protein XlCOF28 n=1 Tax=Stomoxys calcitrans TaxID=35570 RepID=UPI0027E39DC3|nr:oocyte zinc finger protein XlCOF28 [Stomoxys calcitrans]
MSETESIVEEEYIIDTAGYVVLAEGEELEHCDDGTSQIIVLDGEEGQEIVANPHHHPSEVEENGDHIISEDGQMMFVEEVHDIVDEGELVFQQQDAVEESQSALQQPQLSWSELEKKRKRLDVPKVPKKFMLFDGICAEIVDYDEEDGAPIVEFSMVADDKEAEKLPVECGVCPDIMHKSKLDAHLKTHLKPGTKRYKCIYCEDDFVTRAYAAGHSRRHMGIRPYVCMPCKMYYCTKQDLKVHEQRRHLAKEHICEHCGKTFAQNTSLRHHRMLVHEQQRNYECEHCGKKFLRKYAMNEHIRNVHFGDRRLLDCPFCDLRFKDTHKLAQHRKEMHLNQSKFECRICGLEFNHIDFFDAHRRSLQCRKKLARNLYQQRSSDQLDDQEVLQQQQAQQDHNQQEQLQLQSGSHFTYDDDSQQLYQQDEESMAHFKQEQLEQQEVVVEEMTHDMHNEIVNEEDLDHDGALEVDEREKVKAEQQLLYEIAAMDNA